MANQGSTSRAMAALGLLLMLGGAAELAAADRRRLTVDDVLEMVSLGDVAMSPDGRWVFYSEQRLDWPANRRRKSFFLVSAEGGEARPFVGRAGGRGFRFSPDGRSLSLIREHRGSEQVFLLPLDGGEARPLTRHAGGVHGYRWSADGRRIVFVAEQPRGEAAQRRWDAGGDAVFVDEGPNDFDAGHWTHLWLFDVASGSETRLTEVELLIDELDVSPDGERVVFVARPDNLKNHPERAELYLLEVRDRRLRRLTENRAPESRPRWSPDGSRIAYHAPDDESFELRNGFVRIMDVGSGERRRLAGQSQGEIGTLTWTRDGRGLLYSEVRRTDVNLHRLDVATGGSTVLTRVQGTLQPLAFSRDRSRMVYSFDDFSTPPDLYAADLRAAEPVRLTRANPHLGEEVELGQGRAVRWDSADGREIEGVMVLPPGHAAAARVPLMVHIQGGPGGYWGNHFEPEMQLFAALGYANLGPNVRGSTGYGDELLRALMGDVGGGELDDLLSGVDRAVALGIADPAKLALRGWSWGGILGAWTIGHSQRFRAAALGAMVGDWTSETGPGLMWDLREHYIGGDHWNRPQEWRRRSALSYVGRVEIPTLLLHGDRDPVSTVHQSMAFFTALRDRGIPTRLIKFPRQDHDITEPRLARIALVEEVRWMQKHVLGQGWQPAERP